MPQATEELRQKWGDGGDEEAWAQLEGKTVEVAGVITFRKGYEPTDDDLSAVEYLCQEWDYDYKPANVKLTGFAPEKGNQNDKGR